MFPFNITLVKKLNCKVTEIDLPIVMNMMEEFVADTDYKDIILSYQVGWRNELAHQIERMIKLKYEVALRERRNHTSH